MADIPLNYVNSYRDPRNGKMRHQFRRKGVRKVMLKGRPGSAEFMDHYAELLAQSENAAAHVGASKIKPGSIDALIVKYLKSDTFTKGLATATQAARRPILDNFRQCMTPIGHRYGENRLATMQRKNITDALAGKTLIMQKVWLKALRHWISRASSSAITSVVAARPTVTPYRTVRTARLASARIRARCSRARRWPATWVRPA